MQEHSVTTTKFLDKVFTSLEDQGVKRLDKDEFRKFCETIIDKSPSKQLAQLHSQLLSTILFTAWEIYQSKKKPGIKIFKEYIPGINSYRNFIILVNRDCPFLVDTTLFAFKPYGLTAEYVTHPVFKGKDSTDSLIIIQTKGNLTPDIQKQLENDLLEKMDLVHYVTDDYRAMQSTVQNISKSISLQNDYQEVSEYLNWLIQNNSILLGYRYHPAGKTKDDPKMLLGLLKSKKLAALKELLPSQEDKQLLSSHLNIRKLTFRSPVHRNSRVDSFEIPIYDPKTKALKGVHQILGMYTKASFAQDLFHIPIVGRKLAGVFKRFKFNPEWHDGKSLYKILNSIPHDELFHYKEEAIYKFSKRVLYQSDDVVFSSRLDTSKKYMTALIFVPIDKYFSDQQENFAHVLLSHFKGKISSQHCLIGDLPFARFIYVIEFEQPYTKDGPQENIEKNLVKSSLRWTDELSSELQNIYQEQEGQKIYQIYANSLPKYYCDQHTPKEAVKDIFYLEQARHTKEISLYFHNFLPSKEDPVLSNVNIKIFHSGKALPLSYLLPTFENLGFKLDTESSFKIPLEQCEMWIHDLSLKIEKDLFQALSENDVINEMVSLLQLLQHDNVENDALNQLILSVKLKVRQVVLVRSFAKYLKQTGLNYSFENIIDAVLSYPLIIGNLVHYFEERFDPVAFSKNPIDIQETQQKLFDFIHNQLQNVVRLDHDSILRRFLNLVHSILRTNYFQKDKHQEPKYYISYKINSSQIFDLPLPRPLYEIFVYSPKVEAIHLRGDKIARGGIRWSDRFDDFRSEVLSLMKTQMVKNSIIVPLGSKGGFIVKNQREIKNPEDLKNEAIYCYETMMRGLLDLTDNFLNNTISHPKDVIRYDDEDPYLVVAADKGTATFSDIANKISQEYGFWLGDAFASGGSAGYDHKAMGITAKGAWESAKHHFSLLNIDVQTDSFSVIGIGDMSGDVFGNGMLQSNSLQLIAAFNHQDIFLDPTPDSKTSYKERQRLFNLKKSSWQDYNPQLISQGGGVFSRNLKSIPISFQVKKRFNISENELTPDQLIKVILETEVDLLFFGGIGTYIKSTKEQHFQVQDRQNDFIRINGKEIKARVVVEGANLGMTQQGRIEYALSGGRVNDASVDNSGGVNCSDNEVNIKIFLNQPSLNLPIDKRNQLLKEMTQEVSNKILSINRAQAELLTDLEISQETPCQYDELINYLQDNVGLNREVEYLPSLDDLNERSLLTKITRPELAILVSYTKIDIYKKIVSSTIWENNLHKEDFLNYFPQKMKAKYKSQLVNHPLYKEIVCTVLSNKIINMMGLFFIFDLYKIFSISIPKIVSIYFHLVHYFDLDKLWHSITQLNNQEESLHCKKIFQHAVKKILKTLFRCKVDHLNDLMKKNISLGLVTLSNFHSPKDHADKNTLYDEIRKLDRFAEVIEILNASNMLLKTFQEDRFTSTLQLLHDTQIPQHFGQVEDYVAQLNIQTFWEWLACQQFLNDLWNLKIINIQMAFEDNSKKHKATITKEKEIEKLLSFARMDKGNPVGQLAFTIRQLEQRLSLKN